MLNNRKSNANIPDRIPILDELKRKKTLTSFYTQNTFKDIFGMPISLNSSDNKPILLLGIGAFPTKLQLLLSSQTKQKTIYWIECPDFEKQMPKNWHKAIPESWKKCTLEEILPHSSTLHIYKYLPAYQLFSNFWGPIIGKLQQKILSIHSRLFHNNTVVIPTSEDKLLSYELISACKNVGLTPIPVPLTNTIDKNITLIKEINPFFLFSVNLQGLDKDGLIFRLLQAMNIPVALWFVDNPWNILSSLSLPWWKESIIFVTDASFVQELKSYGALHVHHLPLAAWENSIQTPNKTSNFSKPILFIGRTSFPNKNQFFSGCKTPKNILKEAYIRLYENDLPDFHWWIKKLETLQLWPGKYMRNASYATETLSLFRRIQWLSNSSSIGLTIFGDTNWKNYLPNTIELNTPIDYYTSVPQTIKKAKYNLNITSLLLPAALTQRHFDVWTFGGFLLTDATAGLHIFPKELVEPIAISKPDQIIKYIERIEKDSSLRTTLMYAWKQYLLKKHTYSIRIQKILSIIDKV